MATRKGKAGPRYSWTIDFGPETDMKTYATLNSAIEWGAKMLQKRKVWAVRFDQASIQPIEEAITYLQTVREFEQYAHFEPWEMSVVIDTFTGAKVIIRVNRIERVA